MNQESKTMPRWAQWLTGLAMLALALTAGALSLAMNLAAGIAIGIAVAIAFGLSDVAKILIPVTCQAIGWTGHLRATYYMASAISIVCACLYLADQFGGDIALKENAAQLTANADQHIIDLRASLASVRKMAEGEAAKGGCGPKCQALNDDAVKLQTRLSEALSKRETASPEIVDGKAKIIAGLINADEAQASRGIALVSTIADA